MVRRGLLRVLNEEAPTFEDDEENFSDLQDRIRKNIAIPKNIIEDLYNDLVFQRLLRY